MSKKRGPSKTKKKNSQFNKVKFSKKQIKHLTEPDHNSKTYLGDAVFGMEDGLVETLGVTIGVGAAVVGAKLVIIAGVATMFSGAVSMAAGAYLSTKTRNQLYYRELEREKQEMRDMPEVEREEIRQIYYAKGFRGKDLARAVEIITSNNSRWLKIMMEEELGLFKEKQNNPFVAGGLSGIFFIGGAFFPILPYLFLSNSNAIMSSVVLTAFMLFSFGAWKGKHTKLNPWKSGIEMLLVGLLAFAIGSIVGRLLGNF